MDSEQQTMTMSTDDTLGQSSPTAVSASDSLAHISSLAAAAAQATAQQRYYIPLHSGHDCVFIVIMVSMEHNEDTTCKIPLYAHSLQKLASQY